MVCTIKTENRFNYISVSLLSVVTLVVLTVPLNLMCIKDVQEFDRE